MPHGTPRRRPKQGRGRPLRRLSRAYGRGLMDISDFNLTVSLSRTREKGPVEELAPRIRPLSPTCGRPSTRKRYVFCIGLSHAHRRGLHGMRHNKLTTVPFPHSWERRSGTPDHGGAGKGFSPLAGGFSPPREAPVRKRAFPAFAEGAFPQADARDDPCGAHDLTAKGLPAGGRGGQRVSPSSPSSGASS